VADPGKSYPTLPVVADRIRPFVDAGVLEAFDIQLVATFSRLAPDASPLALLALGLVARATRAGHVCVDVDRLSEVTVPDEMPVDGADTLDWPTTPEWEESFVGSPLVGPPERSARSVLRPLVLDGRRLYLHRYWCYEMAVTGQLDERSARNAVPLGGPDLGDTDVEAVLDALFDVPGIGETDLQRLAASRALRSGVSVIAGGPGTGKTHTVARILAGAHLLADRGNTDVRVALTAPTGKAAMRMRTAVHGQIESMAAAGLVTPAVAEGLGAAEPNTIHRLLYGRGPSRSDADVAPFLPFDLVVVDETSMVALPLMAKLLDALGPEARLVLVGDPFQLASIEAGTVMADVVGPGDIGTRGTRAPLGGRVTVLTRRRRFEDDSGIALLADAIRDGDPHRVLEILTEGGPDVAWVRVEDSAALDALRSEVATASAEVAEAAIAGRAAEALAAAERVKVLSATRKGPLGRSDWSDRMERSVVGAHPMAPRIGRVRVGTPLIVTGNDRANGLFNGDVGVLVETDDGPRVAFEAPDGLRLLNLSRLGQWETWWAMTIHKSQGSEFSHAVVSLPAVGSRILSRELLYTAVTRARDKVTVVGGADAIRAAIDRPVARASGLRDRLWPEV
jgi:exodeoxyribonuclease V alpha subunit